MSAEHYIWQPDSLGMATLVLTIVLYLLCLMVVVMRTWTRLQSGLYSLDDGLMGIAQCVFTACCIFTCMGVYTGMGTLDARLEAWNMSATTKVWSIPDGDMPPLLCC